LNISSARLILLNGNTGTAAAGDVIQAFGNFVVGGNYIIGAVIFLVLIAIQYVVINHGAVRISEVTARFTLDALPGKQMSIDSDLNAGLIDEAEARQRRKNLASEAEFYGAMDGASRFTQRDAIASILITGINIIAGFLIGVLQHGMDLRHAIETYTVLTIGDGLVTVIPALMISISGGLIVTRASSDARLGVDFKKQMFSNPQPLLLASGVLMALSAFPGLPTIPFLLLGAGMGTSAWRMRQRGLDSKKVTDAKAAAPARENLETTLKVEPLAVEVGLGLVKLVDGGANSQLLRRISGIRRQLAGDLGYIFPPVRVTDNLGLRPREYAISLKGVEIARYEIPQGCDLAIPVGKTPAPVSGQATREPAFGMPAWWIPSDQAERARRANYTVVDAVSVLGTHLAELIRRHSHELFSRQETKKLLDRVAADNPKVVEELTPKLLPLATV
jgi:flagellar biosynthesis protein FlhA